MKSVLISNNTLFALGTSQKGPTYIIKYEWRPESKERHLKYLDSEIVHNRAASIMTINS